jgi:hypothetical protein
MALTKAEIEAIADRVIALGEERRDAYVAERQEEFKAANDKYLADAPARLERRVARLEESKPSWVEVMLVCYGFFLLSLMISRPRRSSED